MGVLKLNLLPHHSARARPFLGPSSCPCGCTQRRLASSCPLQGSGLNTGTQQQQRPPLPSPEELGAALQEDAKLQMMFWNFVWPALVGQGWRLEPQGSGHYTFLPPPASRSAKLPPALPASSTCTLTATEPPSSDACTGGEAPTGLHPSAMNNNYQPDAGSHSLLSTPLQVSSSPRGYSNSN